MGMRAEPTRSHAVSAWSTRDARSATPKRWRGVSAGEDGEPVQEELAHLELRLVAGGHAARDLGRGACDVRDVGVGELHAVRLGGALHGLRGVPRGACRVTRAVRVAERAVDGDRRVPGVDLVARGVAGERPRDVVDVVGGELLEGGVRTPSDP